ncbi:MAG: UDP-N-acetylmuramoyl-L-alanine--D-glutamate ligase [Gammaproteobacteria bacterium]
MLSALTHMQNQIEEQPRTLIVGLGKTGLSCARFLSAQGVDVAVVDSREHPPGHDVLAKELPEVPVFLGSFEQTVFDRAERIILSPGVPLNTQEVVAARERGCEVIGDIELFARYVQAPVIAITGSNGKSTVTTLLASMAQEARLEVRAGGNLGTPALDLLCATEPDLYVLELSSFQLETVVSLKPVASVVLNVSPDHMDRYTSLKEYAAVKQTIYRNVQHAIINRDDALVVATDVSAEMCSYGLSAPESDLDFGVREKDGEIWLVRGQEALLRAEQLRIPGRHNISNALAALALGDAAGFPLSAMLTAITNFRGLEHRTQWVAESDSVRWYNDSKATNIGAALAAIQAIKGPIVLIAGGQGKGADFQELADGIGTQLRAAVLLGEDADRIGGALGSRVDCHYVSSMQRAVSCASRLARSGDAVLLAPACTSFDMYRDYAQRGDEFVREVEKLVRS